MLTSEINMINNVPRLFVDGIQTTAMAYTTRIYISMPKWWTDAHPEETVLTPKGGYREALYSEKFREDAEKIIDRYKAAVFSQAIPSDRAKRLMERCAELGIAYISASVEHSKLSAEEMREFFAKNGVHLYTEDTDVFYLGCGYMGFHSVKGGTKTVHLPKSCTVEAVYGTDYPKNTTDTVTFELKDNVTALFRIK